MRVLLWAPFGSGEHYWGPGISAYNLYNRGKSLGIKLSLAHGCPDQRKYDLFTDQSLIHRFIPPSSLNTLAFLYASKKWLRRKAHSFDIVHALSAFHYSFMPAIWAEKLGKPSFVKITGSQSGFSENSKISTVLGLAQKRKRYAKRITGYIAISTAIKRELLELGIPHEKVHLIPNGVDVQRFVPVPKARKSALRCANGIPDKFTVLFVGGLSERKRPSLIVEALAILNNNDLQLLIVGPSREGRDVEEEKIAELAKKYGLEGQIIRVPFVSNVEDYYQMSDVFVLPSRNEGLSNALVEAQASGLPSVVTSISGSEDVVRDKINGLFTSAVPEDLADKIEVIFGDQALRDRMSHCARALVLKEYNADMILEKHLELFRKALRARNGF